jgi:ABC-type glycerol-3-phosphate transport system substrate-binding protein
MHIRTAAAAAVILAAALTACSSSDDTTDAGSKPTPKASTSHTPDPAYSDAMKAAGIPPEPTGDERTALLKALAAVKPDVVTYEQRAVDASRNQCSAINKGAQRLDWLASQRFTYKTVTTTEAQGKQINQALKDSGFCKV